MTELAGGEDLLKMVHRLISEDMANRLKTATEVGGTPLTAVEWNAITKFLRDNGIEPDPAEKPLDSLLDGLDDFDEHGNVIKMTTP